MKAFMPTYKWHLGGTQPMSTVTEQGPLPYSPQTQTFRTADLRKLWRAVM